MVLSLVEMARRLDGRVLNQIVRLMWLAVKALGQASMVMRLGWRVSYDRLGGSRGLATGWEGSPESGW